MEIMKNHLLKLHLVAQQTTFFQETPLKYGGKRYWILLAIGLVKDIAERNVCTNLKQICKILLPP